MKVGASCHSFSYRKSLQNLGLDFGWPRCQDLRRIWMRTALAYSPLATCKSSNAWNVIQIANVPSNAAIHIYPYEHRNSFVIIFGHNILTRQAADPRSPL